MPKRAARMPQEGDLLATIEAVHAASLDAELWPKGLAAVTQLFGAAGCTLEAFEKPTGRPRDYHAYGIPEICEREYLDYWAMRNPRAIHGRGLKTGDIAFDYQILDEAAMDRDPYYSELLPRTDFRYFLAGTLLSSPDTHAVLAVQYTRGQGHVQRADIALMARLLPHLRQAYDVATRLTIGRRSAVALEHALDWFAEGILLLRGDGRVIYANAAMQSIARRADGLRLAKGRVEFADTMARERFAAALAATIRMSDNAFNPTGAPDFAAPRMASGLPYLVSVRPIPPAVRDRRGAAEARAIVFVADPLARNAAAIEVLRQVFGLTPAEANLAQALRSGESLVNYARKLRLSHNTVYWHLRRIKEKTGAKRLPELVSLLSEVQVRVRLG